MAGTLLVKNDTGRKVKFTLLDNGTAVDLTGATVKLHYRIAGGTVKTATMTVPLPLTGVAEYQFGAGDLDAAGGFDYEVEVTDTGGKISTFVEQGNKITVRGELA